MKDDMQNYELIPDGRWHLFPPLDVTFSAYVPEVAKLNKLGIDYRVYLIRAALS